MRRKLSIALLALVGLAAPTWAAGLRSGCCPDCTPIPPPDCPDCSCPCEHRLHLTLFGSEHAQQFIATLNDCGGDCCERIKAAKKLGSRLHADFCCDPCVLDALIAALLTDPCWEVRRAAAWAFVGQDARTEPGVLALYISSKMDPHYMVRSRAAEALDIITLCRTNCYKDLYATADRLIVELKAKKFKPGAEGTRVLIAGAFGSGGEMVAAPATAAAPPAAVPPAVVGASPAVPTVRQEAPELAPSGAEPRRLPPGR
jgi:hypothetical protein